MLNLETKQPEIHSHWDRCEVLLALDSGEQSFGNPKQDRKLYGVTPGAESLLYLFVLIH